MHQDVHTNTLQLYYPANSNHLFRITHTKTQHNTHTHTHAHSLSLTCTHTHTSLSLTHTHTLSHTHTHTLSHTHTRSCMNAQKASDTHLISAASEVGCLLATELLIAVLVQEAKPLTQSSERSLDERRDFRPYQGGVVVHLHMTQRHTWSTDKTADNSPAHDTNTDLVHRQDS